MAYTLVSPSDGFFDRLFSFSNSISTSAAGLKLLFMCDLSLSFPFSSKMALCVPKVIIVGHSFVRRLSCDLEQQFDDRAKRNFDLKHVDVRLLEVGGRTAKKIKDFDLAGVFRFAPDVVILEIGANDLRNISPEMVGSEIDDLIKQLLKDFSVRVAGVCLVIPRAESSFNRKVKLLNRYLSVVIDNPNVFLWRHKILDEHGQKFEWCTKFDGVHLNPCGQYLLYRSYRGAILQAV